MKVFPEKKYATVSFPKTDGDYTAHEMYDRIVEDEEELMICDTLVHLEPFDRRFGNGFDGWDFFSAEE